MAGDEKLPFDMRLVFNLVRHLFWFDCNFYLVKDKLCGNGSKLRYTYRSQGTKKDFLNGLQLIFIVK